MSCTCVERARTTGASTFLAPCAAMNMRTTSDAILLRDEGNDHIFLLETVTIVVRSCHVSIQRRYLYIRLQYYR